MRGSGVASRLVVEGLRSRWSQLWVPFEIRMCSDSVSYEVSQEAHMPHIPTYSRQSKNLLDGSLAFSDSQPPELYTSLEQSTRPSICSRFASK